MRILISHLLFFHKGARDEDSKEERKNVDTVLILPSHERDQMMAATFDFPSLSFEDSDESSNWNWNTLLRPNFLDGWYQTLQSKAQNIFYIIHIFNYLIHFVNFLHWKILNIQFRQELDISQSKSNFTFNQEITNMHVLDITFQSFFFIFSTPTTILYRIKEKSE